MVKDSIMRTFFISLIAVFAPIQPLLVTVGFLIAADTITGVIAAYRRGEEIRSSGFSRAVVKLFVYQVVLMSGFLLETYLMSEVGIPITKLIAGLVGVVEMKSLIENTESITGIDLLKIKKVLGSKNDQ